jgi:hypothetical protein
MVVRLHARIPRPVTFGAFLVQFRITLIVTWPVADGGTPPSAGGPAGGG